MKTAKLKYIGSCVAVVLAIVVSCVLSLSYLSLKVSAADVINDEYIKKRTLYQGLSACYQNSLASEVTIVGNGASTSVDDIFSKTEPYVNMPTGFSGTTKYGCKKKNSGVATAAVPSVLSVLAGSKSLGSAQNRNNYFEGMGFTGSNSSGSSAAGEKCMQFTYSYSDISNAKTNELCFKHDSSGKVIEVSDKGGADKKGGNIGLQLLLDYDGHNYEGWMSSCGAGTLCVRAVYEYPDGYGGSMTNEVQIIPGAMIDDITADDVVSFVSGASSSINQNVQLYAGTSTFTSTFKKTKDASTTSTSNDKYTSSGATINEAVRYLSGCTTDSCAQDWYKEFDNNELYYIYMKYLKSTYSAQIASNFCSDTSDGGNYIPVVKKNDAGTGEIKYCPIDNIDSVKSSSTKVRLGSKLESEGKAGDVISALQGMNVSSLNVSQLSESATLAESTTTPGESSEPSASETSETPLCTRASGVLSWFFCPVLDFVGNTVGKIYEWIEDSFLAIPASLMTAGGDNGTYGGWKQFRDFANILFAILFAVVILSQITGIGISNYNIKKMLPRLIMVVVLVNVSFILCQLAVDLSNIVGHGLNTMLRGFAGEDPFTLGGASTLTQALVSGTESDVTSALGGAAGGFLGGLAITAIGVATIRLWILPLFLALVSALVAVAFFFLILGVRQAGIILLVVLAPMAIVCYALPNTKSLFDKWWKVFSALLMVYPICGAMMGGGTFAASILIDNDPDNFFSLIIAMLLTIVPFFFVPTILKNSLNGIAMLGNKLSTLGSQAGRGASKGIERSHGFQDAQQQMQFSRARASLKRQTALRGIGSSLAKTRAGKAVAGAAGAISQYGDRHKILGAGIRGVRGIGQAAADASQRKYLRNAKTAALSDRQQYEANNADAYLTGEVSRQRATDISNAKARYLDPKNSPIDTGDFASMQQEYEKQLDALLADPEDDSAIANVAALQDILSATDDGAAVMMSTLATKANQHSGTEDGRKALRKAATNIDAGAFKGRNRNYYKMATDFANGNFSQVGKGLGTYDSGVTDKKGDKLPPLSYLKAYHDSPAGLKYSAANFGSLDNSAYRQILNGIQNGEITGTNLQNLMETVNEAMSNDNIHLDNNAAGYAQQILSAGYAQTAQPTTGGGTGGSGGTGTPPVARTYGSQAIAHAASAKSISNLTRSVQLGTDPKEGGIETDDAVKIANNMLTAVRDNSNSFTQDQLDAMKSYVSAVNQRGTDSSGRPINFDTREFDSAQINVHGGKTAPAATSAPVSNTSTPSTRPGAVPGTQIIQTPGPNGSTTTQVRGWSGQPIGGSNTVTTNGGIILTGDAADQWRRNNQGGNGSGGPATP